jgi:hypothetical protein
MLDHDSSSQCWITTHHEASRHYQQIQLRAAREVMDQ